LLDKSDGPSAVAGYAIDITNLVAGSGALSGTFNLTYGTGFGDFILAFRDGNNNGFAAFSFDGFPSTADFTMTRDSISHAVLFGKAAAVPGPIVGAGFPGFIFAAGGFLAWRARQRKALA
jgi:hypothetical protein